MPRFTRFGLILAVAGSLLAVAPSLADPVVVVKLFALSAGTLLAWLGLLRTPLYRTGLDRPLAALWLVMAASSTVSVDPSASVFGIYPQAFYGLVPLALCTALYYAVAMSPGEAEIDLFLATLLAASIPLSVYGISQRLFGDLITGLPLPNHERITSSIGNPVMLGACLAMLCPAALHWSLAKKGWLGPVAGVLMATALALTLARGAWLSAASALGLYSWLTGRIRLGRRSWLALALCAPFVFIGLQRTMGRADSDVMRVETAKAALSAFAERPILGWGPDTFLMAFRRHKTEEFLRRTHSAPTVQLSAHNDLLQAAVTLGGLGLLAYLWLIVAVGARLHTLLSGAEVDGRVAAIAAGLAGLFVQAKLNPIPISALALAAVLAGLVSRKRETLSPSAAKATSALAVCFCAACAVVFARFCAADALFKRGRSIVDTTTLADPAFMGGVESLRRATELDPWRLDYLSQRCDVIFRVTPLVPPEQARQLLEKARQLTQEGVRLHPGNPMAHELRATALALSWRLGADTLQEAMREAKTASALDPTFVFSLRRRIEIARASGDRAEFDRAQAEYLRVIALTGDRPGWQPLM